MLPFSPVFFSGGIFMPFRGRYKYAGGTFIPYQNGTFMPPKKTFLFVEKKKKNLTVEFRFDPYEAVFKRILKLDAKNDFLH